MIPPGMKLFLAILVWCVMAAFLAKGVLMAINGSYWLLIAGVVVFVLLVAKIGCLSHD
jgi:hypothetical protein